MFPPESWDYDRRVSSQPDTPLGRFYTLVATGLGSGYSPVAPGTAGSVVGLVLFWPLARTGPAIQAAAILGVFFLGVVASAHLARRVGRKDPGLAVIDEVAGMWITLAWLEPGPLLWATGFFAFRAMDVLKPWPARSLEALPGGWGIMVDDVVAGLYAHLLLRVGIAALVG